MLKTSIIVKNQIEGIHYYAQAPEEVAFLRHPHRHVFHVETEVEVFHHDRELEFIMVQRYLQKVLADMDLNNVHLSCEMIAKNIVTAIRDKYGDRDTICKVFEDGENGAKVVSTIEVEKY